MERFVWPVFGDDRYASDVAEIVRICTEHGVDIIPRSALHAWRSFSDRMGCDWYRLPYSEAETYWIVRAEFESVDGIEKIENND